MRKVFRKSPFSVIVHRETKKLNLVHTIEHGLFCHSNLVIAIEAVVPITQAFSQSDRCNTPHGRDSAMHRSVRKAYLIAPLLIVAIDTVVAWRSIPTN